MKCPVCNSIELVMAERQGVEIDYCPECRGIWLDRGELDKIIQHSYNQPAAQNMPPARHPGQDRYQHQYDYRNHDSHEFGHGGHHRKKSWLAELFD